MRRLCGVNPANPGSSDASEQILPDSSASANQSLNQKSKPHRIFSLVEKFSLAGFPGFHGSCPLPLATLPLQAFSMMTGEDIVVLTLPWLHTACTIES